MAPASSRGSRSGSGCRPTTPTAQAAIEACTVERMSAQTNMPNGFFGKAKSGTWRDALSGSDLRLVEYIFGEEMARYGYERAHPRSKIKPFRLWFHERLSARLARCRGLWRRLSRGMRKSAAHRRAEIRYTQSKNSR